MFFVEIFFFRIVLCGISNRKCKFFLLDKKGFILIVKFIMYKVYLSYCSIIVEFVYKWMMEMLLLWCSCYCLVVLFFKFILFFIVFLSYGYWCLVYDIRRKYGFLLKLNGSWFVFWLNEFFSGLYREFKC